MKLPPIILALTLLSGCAGPASTRNESWPTNAPYSGFLSDYSQLRPVPGQPGTLIDRRRAAARRFHRPAQNGILTLA